MNIALAAPAVGLDVAGSAVPAATPAAAPAVAPATPAAAPGPSVAGLRASATLRRLGARLRGLAGKAIEHYRMIEAGDRVMVCVSGGKDSYTLLDVLCSLQRSAEIRFELLAVNLDQKQPGFPAHVLPRYFESIGVPYHIIEQDTYRVVKRVIPEGRTLCSLCSRLRRGALYRFAAEHGISKIALGHHREDIVETLFLNLFHAGRLKAMAPKLRSQDGRHIVIRPLAYVAERDIARYARGMGFPLIPCRLCGSQPNLPRNAVKGLLAAWERAHPGRTESILSALRHVEPATLADPVLFDFAALAARPPAAAEVEVEVEVEVEADVEADVEVEAEDAAAMRDS